MECIDEVIFSVVLVNLDSRNYFTSQSQQANEMDQSEHSNQLCKIWNARDNVLARGARMSKSVCARPIYVQAEVTGSIP